MAIKNIESEVKKILEQDKDTRNWNNEVKKVIWIWDWGVLIPVCPTCKELAYEDDRCVFCGQPYLMTPKPIEDAVVRYKQYMAVKVGGADCVNIYKDDKLVCHCDLEEGTEYSIDDLKNLIKNMFYGKKRKRELKVKVND